MMRSNKSQKTAHRSSGKPVTRKPASRASSKLPPVYRGRRLVLMLVLLMGIGVLLIRAGYLEVFQQSWLQAQADKRQMRTVTVPPYRGVIVDRNGESLAISSPVESISVDPKKLLDMRNDLQKIILEFPLKVFKKR